MVKFWLKEKSLPDYLLKTSRKHTVWVTRREFFIYFQYHPLQTVKKFSDFV